MSWYKYVYWTHEKCLGMWWTYDKGVYVISKFKWFDEIQISIHYVKCTLNTCLNSMLFAYGLTKL